MTLSLIKEWHSTSAIDSIDVLLKRHPYPPYAEDSYVNVLQTQFPFIVMLSFIIVAPNICKDVCLEKEKGLKVTVDDMHGCVCQRPCTHIRVLVYVRL